MHVSYKFGLFLIFILSVSVYYGRGTPLKGEPSFYGEEYRDDDYGYYDSDEGEDDSSQDQQTTIAQEAKKKLTTTTTTTVKTLLSLFNLPKRNDHVLDPTCPKECLCLEDFKLINCAHAHLKHVPPDLPRTAYQVDLSNNQIELIRKADFANRSKLMEINLNNNHLRELNKEIFSGLTRLQRLHLASNLLTTIEPDTFHGATALTLLDLSNNSIVLPQQGSLLNQSSLLEFYCRNCSWSHIYKDTFKNTPSLTVLRIDQNDFGRKINTFAFTPLKNLIKLSLPDLDQNNTEKLCDLLQAIDNISFKRFNVSCYELVLEGNYNESIILTTDRSFLNPRWPKKEIGIHLTTVKPINNTVIKDTTKMNTNVNMTYMTNNNNNNNNSNSSNNSTNSNVDSVLLINTSTVSSVVNSSSTKGSEEAYQVPVSPETIDRMLIGLMVVSIIGLIVGLICRNDVGGIKTKCCRTRKVPTENEEDPDATPEEIPLNKIS
uniref:LRRNT domain-containing protein n=1 Tax=Glossina austeni TaxID=7395 RepID=A0A1A9V4D3_GLOAU